MAPLNENQKLYMWLGIAICVAMGLYPPWKYVTEVPAPFAFLYAPPTTAAVKLDVVRLVVEWCIVAFVTGGLIVSNQKSPVKNSNAKTTANNSSSSKTEAIPSVVAQKTKAESNTSSGSTKSIKFPDFSVGEVLVESDEDPDYWDGIGEARGLVEVPSRSNVQLEALKERPMHVRGLKEMDANALQSIDFSESEVSDEDLNYIVHFSKLYELDLSETKVGDDGIEHLSKISSLRKLWLDNTKVTEESLENLKKLPNLTKISLTGTDITEASIKAAKDGFPANCEIIMASGVPA